MRIQLSLLVFLIVTISGFGQTFPANFSRVQVGGTIANPTVLAFAPDGRIFAAEQGGIIRVIKNNQQLPTPFITLTVNSSGERGLIGIAFDPAFNNNHYVYLYYTTAAGGTLHNRISRFTANGDVVLAGSELIVLELDPLSSATNHNGGAIAFGKDGKLYVAVGENADGSHAPNLDTYHGKFLRINKDGSAPADNPFNSAGVTEQRKRVWSYGLRNPYTFSIHPVSGRILLNDVGQSTWEEVNDATTSGKNFGWPTSEGVTANPAFTSPIFAYRHTGAEPTGCAITGGVFLVSDVNNYPEVYKNKYFFMDHCNRWLYCFDPNVAGATSQQFALEIGSSIVALTVGPDGNLYYMSRGLSRLYKIVYSPPATPPAISQHPQPATVIVGQNATFSATATGTAPITYQWQKNGVNIVGATQASLTIVGAQPADEGNYRVVATNGTGNATSNAAALIVIPGPPDNHPPVAEITAPLPDLLYTAGTTVSFEGTAMDEDEGPLPASAFSWAINFHHDTHKHDQPAITGVASGEFDIPDRGETASNVWYRFILTVTDATGLQSKDSVDVHPATSNLTFQTVPPGLQVTIDGQPVETPVTITSVEGLLRDIGVPTGQNTSSETYTFASWSQGGAITQTIQTPADNKTYTATFSVITGMDESIDNGIVYPNPVDDKLNVSDGIETVTLISSVGQLIQPALIEPNVYDVSKVAAGVYVLFYSGNAKSGRIRIVVR